LFEGTYEERTLSKVVSTHQYYTMVVSGNDG